MASSSKAGTFSSGWAFDGAVFGSGLSENIFGENMFFHTFFFAATKGTDNMGAIYFALGCLQLPIVVFWDLLHQGVNDVMLAIHRSGFWTAVLELFLVFRLPYGPWAGQKFWHDLQDAANLANAANATDDSFFQSWLGEKLQTETGSSKPFQDCWEQKGVRATLSRWFSWWWANKDLRRVWWSKLSILLFTLVAARKLPPASIFDDLNRAAAQTGLSLSESEAIRKNKKAQKSKKKKETTAEPPNEVAEAPAEAPAELEGCKENEQIKATKMQSMMHAAAAALARDKNFEASAMLHHFVAPFAIAHAELAKMLKKGSADVARMYMKCAQGQRLSPAFESIQKLHDIIVLSEVGLIMEASSEAHLSALDDDILVAEQDTIASRAESLVWQLCRQSAYTSAQFSDTLIGKFAIVFSTDEAEKQIALKWVKLHCDAYQAAAKINSPVIKALLLRSDCSRPVEKRICQNLQEDNFSSWTDFALAEICTIYSAEVSTGIVENAFKELRAAEKGFFFSPRYKKCRRSFSKCFLQPTGSSNQTTARLTRHLSLINSNLPERFGRATTSAKKLFVAYKQHCK